MHAVETKQANKPLYNPPWRVVLIGDREIKNLSTLLYFQKDQPTKALNTVGFIAAGHEVTETFFGNIDRLFTGGNYTCFTADDQTFEICVK